MICKIRIYQCRLCEVPALRDSLIASLPPRF